LANSQAFTSSLLFLQRIGREVPEEPSLKSILDCGATHGGVLVARKGWQQTIAKGDLVVRGPCHSVRYAHRLKANSHRHARHDKTVLSVSRTLRWCELDSRQLKTVADRKFEV